MPESNFGEILASIDMLHRYVGELGRVQARLIEHLQAQTRSVVDEWDTSGAGDTTLSVQPQTSQLLERIEFILVELPIGTTSARLTLPGVAGDRVISLQNTTVALGPMAMLLAPRPRVLTYAPAGPAFLELMGTALPLGGVL